MRVQLGDVDLAVLLAIAMLLGMIGALAALW